MEKEKQTCSYCGNRIVGYVRKSKLDSDKNLCFYCYCIERTTMTMAEIIKESEDLESEKTD